LALTDANGKKSGTARPRKSRRDPERTREAILEVAGRLLAKDGPEGLSVSQVAKLAGVNRGTAYHHFQTREDLLNATKVWVSEKLCREVFGDVAPSESPEERLDPGALTQKLVRFAMDNPEFGRVWLFEVLSASRPANDPFWNRFKAHIDHFARSELAQPGIDPEVNAVTMLVGLFLWPVWARAQARNAKEREKLSQRFVKESLRLARYGIIRKEMFPELETLDAGELAHGE